MLHSFLFQTTMYTFFLQLSGVRAIFGDFVMSSELYVKYIVCMPCMFFLFCLLQLPINNVCLKAPGSLFLLID